MSDAKFCDNCGETLVLDSRGDDENGEIAAWISITSSGGSTPTWDACTRQCAHQLIDGPIRVFLDERAAQVAEVARVIHEGREGDE